MSGESHFANTIVDQAFTDVETRPDMNADAMGRALIQAVVARYLTYRSIADVSQELTYLVESLDDDDPVVTRGC